MKKQISFLLLLTVCLPYAFAQANNKSYINIKTPLVPTNWIEEFDGIPFDFDGYYEIDPDLLKETTNYTDGLGRTTQVVNLRSNTIGTKDQISFTKYDELGQSNKSYLPYFREDNFGNYATDAINEQESYYLNVPTNIAFTTKPFSETLKEASPYKRTLKVGAVGEEWQLNQHDVELQYETNTANDILFWTVNSSAPYTATAMNTDNITKRYYAANKLFRAVTKDQNNKEVIQYTNSLGQLICSRTHARCETDGVNYYTQDNTNGTLNSVNTSTNIEISNYYVYNDFGQLVYEIPFTAIQAMGTNLKFGDVETINKTTFIELIYAYHYDERGRLIEKHVPGNIDQFHNEPLWNFYVYNQLDQLVFTQDPNQSINPTPNWSFVKYDSFGRAILTGKYNSSSSRASLQATLNSTSVTHFWENRSSASGNVHGYTNNSYPIVQNEIYTINYYDDYDFDIQNRTYQTWGDNVKSIRTKGMLTGSKVKILGSNPEKYLLTVNYYDEFGRAIQSHREHHLHGWDVYNNEYDFTGKLIKNQRYHTNFGNPSLTITNRYTYDNMGRPRITYQQTGNDPEIVLKKNSYNEIGQLIKKQLYNDDESTDYMQNIDYRYNERGWLTNINNSPLVDDGITNGDINDVFGEEILYNSGEIINTTDPLNNPSGINMQKQYDGKIAAIKWMTKDPTADGSTLSQSCYVYRYDDLGRMTGGFYANDGNHGAYSDVFATGFHDYDERVSYDLNGNIKGLLRQRGSTLIDRLSYTYSNNGYRLTKVDDASSQAYSSAFPQFINGANSTTEYTYDYNGNQRTDDNKGISTKYNHLNLPVTVQKNMGGTKIHTITFIYDATGRLLSKKMHSSLWPLIDKLPDGIDREYIDGIEYDGDDHLLYTATGEGVVREKNSTANNITDFVYDYYIKDHLGNVRAIITNENATYTEGEVYVSKTASMEMSNDPAEEEYFDNLDETRKNKTPDYPYNPNDPYNSKVSKLGTALGTTVGPSTVLAVKQGDELSVSTEYYFTTPNEPQTNQTAAQILAGIVGNIATAGIGVLPTDDMGAVINPFEDGGSEATGILNNFISSSFDTLDLTLPQGYLVYLFFDNKMNLDPAYSGVERVIEAGSLQQLAVMNQKMPADGFYYTYVTNQSQKSMQFDNFTYIHIEGQLREVNDYYPYGMLCSSATISDYSKTKFQSKEHNSKEFAGSWGLDWYNHGARMYDPELGRWHVQDPAGQFSNPYLAMANNPVSFSDADGMVAVGMGYQKDPKRFGDAMDHQKIGSGGGGLLPGAQTNALFNFLAYNASEATGSPAGLDLMDGGIDANNMSSSANAAEAASYALAGNTRGGNNLGHWEWQRGSSTGATGTRTQGSWVTNPDGTKAYELSETLIEYNHDKKVWVEDGPSWGDLAEALWNSPMMRSIIADDYFIGFGGDAVGGIGGGTNYQLHFITRGNDIGFHPTETPTIRVGFEGSLGIHFGSANAAARDVNDIKFSDLLGDQIDLSGTFGDFGGGIFVSYNSNYQPTWSGVNYSLGIGYGTSLGYGQTRILRP